MKENNGTIVRRIKSQVEYQHSELKRNQHQNSFLSVISNFHIVSSYSKLLESEATEIFNLMIFVTRGERHSYSLMLLTTCPDLWRLS